MSKCALNVGVLGHVDSGKTSLTKAIAQLASTNAFDSHAQNDAARHNTLDLGFSSLTLAGRRLALVDCPGHADLIRAVLAASCVLDMAILVVDAKNGIQPQTAEHLLLCSVFCPDKVLVLLNKIDLVEPSEINGIIAKIRKGLSSIGVKSTNPIVPISLLNADSATLQPFLDTLTEFLFDPPRNDTGNFLMAVDHCFAIKGQGTVMTGTVIDGTIRINQEIELPTFKEKKKVKGLQHWKEKVNEVSVGERAAVLVQQLNAEAISRTIVCAPGTLLGSKTWLVSVHWIPFFRGQMRSGVKVHVSVAFETVMADCVFLWPSENDGEWEQRERQESDKVCNALMTFDRTVYARTDFNYMASRLDYQLKGCRFAFRGHLLKVIEDPATVKRFVRKEKCGRVERVESGGRSAICDGMFKRESNLTPFLSACVRLSTGEVGRVESAFGKSGKIRVTFASALSDETQRQVAETTVEVRMYLKKFLPSHEIRSYIPTENQTTPSTS